jgi:hypothetical protein
MNPNVNLIGLEVYRDGTTPYKRTADQLGLSFVSFLTFRQHYHCGEILVECISLLSMMVIIVSGLNLSKNIKISGSMESNIVELSQG